MATFTPPGRVEHRGNHPLFGRLRFTQGVSLLKEGGIYRQVEIPTYEELVAADVTYVGGHTYEIGPDEAAALIAAGYGDYIDFGIQYGPYGLGPYGGGPYGGAT